MNIDEIILNKILSSQLLQHIKKITHHDQVGIIPKIEAYLKICKSTDMICYINNIKGKNKMSISIV
jgi:hypothetical protein